MQILFALRKFASNVKDVVGQVKKPIKILQCVFYCNIKKTKFMYFNEKEKYIDK